MTALTVLNEICFILDTYRGRDKLLKALCYTTKLLAAVSNDDEAKRKYQKFSSLMSTTRSTLRLFDDLPTLKNNLEYGLGEHEPDSLAATLGVTSNLIDTLFYPIEKISWLAEHEIIDRDEAPWGKASSVCWVVTVYLAFIKTLRSYFRHLRAKATHRMNGDMTMVRQISIQQKAEIVTLIRLILDFIHAVHSLPAGFLWSSQLKPWQVGFIGTLSSFIGIYQMFSSRYNAGNS